MFWKLLVEYLRPHRKLLAAVVVFQLAQSSASLHLPTLNAGIIDEGVAILERRQLPQGGPPVLI